MDNNKKIEEVNNKLQNKKLPTIREKLGIVSWRQIIEKIIWGIILFVLAFFFTRVWLWEKNYYETKEGSERETAITVSTQILDETKPTPEQVTEYTVPASHPRYLSVEKLGITNSRIISVGVASSGALDTPINIFDTGWYTASGTPGSGKTIVIDGHNGGPSTYGVFKRLPDLTAGDIISIERGDGAFFRYSVVDNETVPLAEADAYMSKAFASPQPGTESLTLISCTGEWNQARQTYLSRQFTRAVLIEE